jgi:hypothetical protein
MGSLSIWHWIILIFVLVLILPLAFLPTIIAIRKNHPYKIAIILINIFGGLLYGIGWLVALVWCFILPKKVGSISGGVADELDLLHQLKEKGALTQEEFDTRKKRILGS